MECSSFHHALYLINGSVEGKAYSIRTKEFHLDENFPEKLMHNVSGVSGAQDW
jgi:hypothetical protein